MFKDYYDEFSKEGDKSLDPTKDRKFNQEKLNLLSAYYAQLHGAKADLKLNFVKEAQTVFGAEASYNQYRLEYTDYKLMPYMEGAAEENVLPKNKYTYLVKRKAAAAGISETEVQGMLKRNGITIGSPKGSTPDDKADQEAKKSKADQEKASRQEREQAQKLDEERKRKRLLEIELRQQRERTRKLVKQIVIVFMILIATSTSFFILKPNKQVVVDKTVIDLAQAIEWINIYPPEFSKAEEAVASLQVNADNPEAKEGLLKAAEVFIGFGDNTASTEEKREYYKIALECNKLAEGSREGEIKAKIEELDFIYY